MNLHKFNGYCSHCSCDEPVKKTTMTVKVDRINTSILYRNIVNIEIQDDGAVRMVCKDGAIFVTRGKYEIEVEG